MRPDQQMMTGTRLLLVNSRRSFQAIRSESACECCHAIVIVVTNSFMTLGPECFPCPHPIVSMHFRLWDRRLAVIVRCPHWKAFAAAVAIVGRNERNCNHKSNALCQSHESGHPKGGTAESERDADSVRRQDKRLLRSSPDVEMQGRLSCVSLLSVGVVASCS